MTYKPTVKDIIIGILLIALFVQIYQKASYSKVIDDFKSRQAYQDTRVDSILNKYNQVVVEKKSVETENSKTIKKLSEEVFHLRKQDEKRVEQVYALVRTIQDLKLDTPIFIPYKDTVRVYPPGSMVNVDSVVVPPKQFKDSTNVYVVDGTVLLKGVKINNISIPDTSSFRIIDQKPKGFFNKIIKPNETVVQNIHSNPLYKTKGIQSITLKNKPNAWQRWIKPLLFSTATGIFTYKVLK